jgi:phosphotransferase system  glucose/maltose/N-acetylglucosamine-specific IIC component
MNDNGGVGALLGGGVCMLVVAVLGIAILAFWVWALIDAIKNPRLTDNERLIWIIVILLTNWLGAVIYLIVGRKK